MLPAEEGYTLGGPACVERAIESHQRRVAAQVGALLPDSRLCALVLAGGYGRGEGGFRQHAGGVAPYNDYDYFVVVGGIGRRGLAELRGDLHRLGERLGREFELEVDFAVLPAERLARLPACLMYSELKWRHRTLLGDRQVLAAIPSPPAEQLPLSEFSRMMLNRGTLLLMNEQALSAGTTDAAMDCERFVRYVSKGLLAAADARLAADGRYHPSLVVRGERLRELAWSGEGRDRFLALYDEAVRIKLGGASEATVDREGLVQLQSSAVREWRAAFRLIEARRLGRPFGSWVEYATAAVPKGQAAGRWWSTAHHAWLAVSAGSDRLRRSALRRVLAHPRERLMAALPLLLERPGHDLRRAAEALGADPAASWSELVETFLADWRRYC